MPSTFSELLTTEQLAGINYYTYYPVTERHEGHRTVCRLLPSDDAVAYTFEFEVASRNIISGELSWYSEPLHARMDPANLLPEGKIRTEFRESPHRRCIVINLLDHCFGHSFVKFLNILDFYEKYSHTHELVVLSFGYVKDFLPSGKFSIIHLDLSFGEVQKLYSLNNVIQRIRQRFEEVDFAILEAFKRFPDKNKLVSFFNFFGDKPNPWPEKKFIVYNYRKGFDRAWDGLDQAARVRQLFTVLRRYVNSDVIFCVIGDKDRYAFPDWVLDKRIDRFPNPILYEYNHILNNSIFAIGVMGSHMIAASVLSQMTVHVTPERYLRVASTDIVNYATFTTQSYFSHLYLQTNATSSDLRADDAAYRILVTFVGRLLVEHKDACHQLLSAGVTTVPQQKAYIAQAHPYFDYERFLTWKAQRDHRHAQAIRMKMIWAKLRFKK